MRCVARIAILTVLAFIVLIYLAVQSANSKIVVGFDENDEEARRILENAIPSPTNNQNNNIQANLLPKQSLSLSVALVLIVSLISVALLITGIIIIAVTLDPSGSGEDDESDLEPDEKAPFQYSNGYYPLTSSTLIEL
ncbi:unnamed protein product [Caenorhabditis bovis]|uniref:Uncharacterized protein n=1 Tax=Caenorhabditis bovis TaxID=2654633 RepID=A0A8S1EV21_9PELO|nr:unnamed protein product [Caenorhabditis bovis]